MPTSGDSVPANFARAMRFHWLGSVIFSFSSVVALMKLLTAVLSESIFVGWFQPLAIFSAIEPDTSSTSTMSSGWFVTISPVSALFAPVTFNATLYVPSPLAVTVFSRAGADNVGSSGTPFVPPVERGAGTLAAASHRWFAIVLWRHFHRPPWRSRSPLPRHQASPRRQRWPLTACLSCPLRAILKTFS